MDEAKRKRLQAMGGRITTVEEFLSESERAWIAFNTKQERRAYHVKVAWAVGLTLLYLAIAYGAVIYWRVSQ